MNHSTTDNQLITFNDFMKVDIRTGTVVAVEDFPEARKPAFKLTIDFGSDIGVKRSSAQITVRYKKEELVGRQIVAVVNFPPRQIANFFSEVLVLGSVDTEGVVVLLTPDARVENGLRIAWKWVENRHKNGHKKSVRPQGSDASKQNEKPTLNKSLYTIKTVFIYL